MVVAILCECLRLMKSELAEMDKKFIIFRPSELANASSPIQKIVDIIRGCAEVEL